MQKIGAVTISAFLTTSSLFALDLSVGYGTFNLNGGLKNLINGEVEFDIEAYSIREKHKNISLYEENIFYYFNATLYRADAVDEYTNLISYPMTNSYMPGNSILNSSPVYVPTSPDYKLNGFDLSVGLGYDIWRNDKNYFGVAVNSGISMPVMKTENMVKDAQLTLDLMDSTKTKIMTYKTGVSANFEYFVLPDVSIYGFGAYSFQTGWMKNEYLSSSVDIDGTLLNLDIGINYSFNKQKIEDFEFEPSISLGYAYNKWDVNEINLKMVGNSIPNTQVLDFEIETDVLYFGVGIKF